MTYYAELLDGATLRQRFSVTPDLFPTVASSILSPDNNLVRYLCVHQGAELLGVAKVSINSNINLDFVEVSERHRHEHVSNFVVQKLFEEASNRKCSIGTEGFTESGRAYLVREIERCEKLYGVEFVAYKSC